jgi:hypothetical protein
MEVSMELHEALTQIAEIHQGVARAEKFHGYRAVPVAFSGILAIAAAMLQPLVVGDPGENFSAYLVLWLGAAVLSVGATGLELLSSLHKTQSRLERQKTFVAITQFLPCLLAGALLLVVMARYAADSVWMLPGLWEMLFGLGIFASCRLLPRAVFWVGAYYLAAGAMCMAMAQGDYALSPWAMGLPFGIGQLLCAGVLWNSEVYDEQE